MKTSKDCSSFVFFLSSSPFCLSASNGISRTLLSKAVISATILTVPLRYCELASPNNFVSIPITKSLLHIWYQLQTKSRPVRRRGGKEKFQELSLLLLLFLCHLCIAQWANFVRSYFCKRHRRFKYAAATLLVYFFIMIPVCQ